MATLNHLAQAGIGARLSDAPEGQFSVEVEVDDQKHRFSVEQRARAPYPSEVNELLTRNEGGTGTPLLIAPYVSKSLGDALTRNGWSWADVTGNFDLRAQGLRLRQRLNNSPPPRPPRTRSTLPQGTGSLAIIRFLIKQSDSTTTRGPTELANIAGVTQPRASQVLAKLKNSGLVERTTKGWHAHKASLLDAFIADYRGPGGSELPLYSLDDPLDAAGRICQTYEADQHMKIAVSADVGPDLVAPWMRPTKVIVYASSPVELDDLDLVRAAGRSDANVLLRIPSDVSVFRFPPLEAEVKGQHLRLADEAQMIWDLHDLGGDDRTEAADHLRQWVLNAKNRSNVGAAPD
jgi:hypothetical protein